MFAAMAAPGAGAAALLQPAPPGAPAGMPPGPRLNLASRNVRLHVFIYGLVTAVGQRCAIRLGYRAGRLLGAGL